MAAENLQIPNYADINLAEDLVLDADVLAGLNTAQVVNAQNVAADKFIVFGANTERGEIMRVQSVAGKVITFTTNFANSHRKHQPAHILYGNQIKVYRADNVDGNAPADAAFNSVGTVGIDADQPSTKYIDGGGGNDKWYKFTYFNEVSEAETVLGLSVAIRGGGWGHYVSIEDIRIEAGLQNNRNISNGVISTRRNHAEDEINGVCKAAGYNIPLQTSSGASFVPPIIENIALLLSAGLLMGANFNGSEDDKQKAGGKARDARSVLKGIADKKTLLLDANGNELARTDAVSGYPDDAAGDNTSENYSPAKFTMEMKL